MYVNIEDTEIRYYSYCFVTVYNIYWYKRCITNFIANLGR